MSSLRRLGCYTDRCETRRDELHSGREGGKTSHRDQDVCYDDSTPLTRPTPSMRLDCARDAPCRKETLSRG
jgi:hypothetical protein